MQKLLAQFPGIKESVSATTREPRPGEIDGTHYHFLTRKEFNEWVSSDLFMEYAEYNQNLYGTPLLPLQKRMKKGLDTIVILEIAGAANVKKMIPESVLIFISPPSIEELERRLKNRGTESDEEIQKRLSIAREELEHSSNFDHVVINVDEDYTYNKICAIIICAMIDGEHNARTK